MDLDYLQQVTGQAGYRIDWTALTGLSARHPEPVLDWIAAAADHAAADTGHRLLTATAAALRDRVAGTQPGRPGCPPATPSRCSTGSPRPPTTPPRIPATGC